MGAKNEYKCQACNYTCDVSGGSDIGMRSYTETCVCTNCKILLDIHLISKKVEKKEEKTNSISSNLPPYPKKPKLTFLQKLIGKKLDLKEYYKKCEEHDTAADKAYRELYFLSIKEHSCPKCDGFYLEKWDEKHPCPKCNSRMKLSILWKIMFD